MGHDVYRRRGFGREELQHNLAKWKGTLEGRGMKISRRKTEYTVCTDQEQPRQDSFKMDDVELESGCF